jgi:hypothetical protein
VQEARCIQQSTALTNQTVGGYLGCGWRVPRWQRESGSLKRG